MHYVSCNMFLSFIRYYAQNTTQSHIANIYRIARNECAIIIQQVSKAIISELKNEVMDISTENWVNVANAFNYKWQLPNCVGAIDGKHIAIKKPDNAGSQYFNYKRYHSIILMATSDANYKFISIDAGAAGAEGDRNTFLRTKIGSMIIQDHIELNLPPDARIAENYLPHFFIADDAFPLAKRLMKPYPSPRNATLTNEELVYNYRISRARRCIESAFGILSMKWGCINQTFKCQPEKVKNIVAACCLLHNFLLNRTPADYIPDEFKDQHDTDSGNYQQGEWRRRTSQNYDNTHITDPTNIRNALKHFVNSPAGSVRFQDRGARVII